MEEEKWLPVPGYEGKYEASDHGRIRGLDRHTISKNGTRKPIRGRVLLQKADRKGYLRIGMHINGMMKGRFVHTVICETFHGPRLGRMTNHMDFNPANNAASNLEWVSHAGNMAHSKAAGHLNATTNPNQSGRLSLAIVEEMRALSAAGVPSVRLAEKYGVAKATVSAILCKKTWRLPDEPKPAPVGRGAATNPRMRRKLTPEKVAMIHKMRATGMAQHKIAAHFGIGTMTVNRVVRGLAWRESHPTLGSL